MSLVLQEISRQYIVTNNGLEQVYQNRLIEGVDYERWDWLVGDGEAYYNATCNFTYGRFDFGNIKFIDTTDKVGMFMYFMHSNNWAKVYLKYNSSGALRFAWQGGATDVAANIKDGTLVVTSKNNGTASGNAIYNGQIINNSTNININSGWYFSYIGNVSGKVSAPKGVGISKIEYSLRNTGYVQYTRTPVKLLAPCPANLSSTGKPYPIGECGMIDNISGKFYGNSGSGSFSVYNDPVTE